MNKRERASAVADLRRAAKDMAQAPAAHLYGCCGLISNIHAYSAFQDMMRPQERYDLYWWPRDENHRHVRVMALLFVAAAVEAGDWP